MIDHAHISDLRFDRLFAGELSVAERDLAHAHVDHCVTCGARLRELEAERAAFVLRPLPLGLAPRPRFRPRWWWTAPISALAAAAIAVVFLKSGVDAPDGERTKGSDGPQLLLMAGQADQLVAVVSDDAVHPGDYLQAGYTAMHPGFGAVLSRDGAGHASTYVPASGDAMVALPAGTERSFPASTILDDVIGTERIAIVWCKEARPLAPLVAELGTSGTLEARDGCTMRVIALAKGTR